MPRDLSGNMTLVTGNPVVSGTAASSAVINNTMTDLAAEIQDSLSRSGKGGMTAPFKNSDGTEGAPSITFTNESTTGWFRYAAGEIRMSILGAWKFAWKAAGLVVKGTLGLMDSGGTNKTATLAPPSGLVADYTLTLPATMPSGTTPVTLTSGGVLGTAFIDNSLQAFGTPSAATDVVIKSYVDTAAAQSWTALTIGGTGCSAGTPAPSYTVRLGVVYLKGQINVGTGNTPTITALPAGYRPGDTRKFQIGVDIGNTPNLGFPIYCAISSVGAFTVDTNTYGVAGGKLYLDGVSFPAEG